MFLDPGTIIDGKYEVRGMIGSGGMGVIYEAHQAAVDRLVAVKVLTYATTGSSSDLQRFEREALILSRLSHPNIVQFLGYGLWENYPYIVMERLTGISLQKVLAQSDSPAQSDRPEILPIAIQICDALHHAHEEGVLHRDIKPSNIILTKELTGSTESIAKLIDFGLARLTGIDGRQKLTQTGMAIGSVQYMSPEQCAGQVVDARTDIYALGCVLYECFTGEPPFTADNGVAMMFQHLNEPVTATPKWNTLTPSQQHVLAKCLAKRPQHRYVSAAELREDLLALSADETPRSAPAQIEPAPQAAGKRSFSRTAVLAALLVVAATVCIILAINNAGIAPKDDTLSGVQADELLQQARNYYSIGDDEHAIEALTRINEFVAAHPTEVSAQAALDAKRQLGSIYLYHQRNAEKALPLFLEARALSKQFGAVAEAENLRLASDALRYMGKKDQALDLALQANTLVQDNLKNTPRTDLSKAELFCAEGWRQVGACYQDLGKLREAELPRRNAWKSAQISGNKYQMLWATRELSYNLADFGNFKKADAVLDTVLRPDFDKTSLRAEQLLELSQCYSHRGNLRRELGDPQGSLRDFDKAVEYARKVSSPAAAESLKGLLLYQALNFYFLKKRDAGDKALTEADKISHSNEQLEALRKRVVEARASAGIRIVP